MENFENQPSQNSISYDVLSEMPSFDQWRRDRDSKQTEAPEHNESAEQTEVDPHKLETFNKFVDFFKKDSDIKSTLFKLAPSEQDIYGDGAVRYADRLYEGTRDIIYGLESIMKNFYQSDVLEKRLKQIQENVINAGADPDKLTQTYRRDFASMSEDLVKDIQQDVVGYSLWRNPHQFDSKAVSINEILHLIHSSIVNNEDILQSLPVLESGKTKHNETFLYGTTDSKNPVAQEIFDQMKKGEEYLTDIVSLPERTLMMVRGRGHALTMDIEKDPNDSKYYVNYFIPKICNVEKVNQLPGVRRVLKKDGIDQSNEFTTGAFSIQNENDVASGVVDFIKKVPTDANMNPTMF